MMSHQISLTVCQADEEDVYRDVIRIPKVYRKNIAGKEILSGTICKVIVGNESVCAIIRGKLPEKSEIYIDGPLRKKLSVSLGQDIDVSLKEANFIDKGWWALNTTDPGYRISAWIALASMGLGAIPSLISFIMWTCDNLK